MKLVTEEHVRNLINEGVTWKGYVDSSEFTVDQIEMASRHSREFNSIEMLERAINAAQRYLTDRRNHKVVFWEV